jgi:hypothetical protein
MAGDDGPPVTFVHDDCGHTTTPTLVCSECRDELDPRALRATFKLPAPTRETRAESRKENR